MKNQKKKKSKEDLDHEPDDGRQVPFGALAELTTSDVIAQVKMGMSRIEPLELENEIDDLDNLDEDLA